MIIKYTDEIEFYNGIHELVKRGIMFRLILVNLK